ncbi:MAG TPA: histidine phosphatase family protein, partial [Bellilinea sp.]|nr:histidine phosphatase family protein [Bellilinea sp.]
DTGMELKWELEAAWMAGERRAEGMPGGENFNDIYARYVPFIRKLVDSPRNDGKTLLLSGHGSATQLMLPQIASNVTYEFIQAHPLYNTSLVFLEKQADGTLQCTQYINDPDNAASGIAI